jgi:retinol dehydrogenase 14
LVKTGIYAEVTGPFAWFMKIFSPVLRRPPEAAETAVYVASSPELDGVSGWYFKDRRPTRESALAGDPQFRREVWEFSVAATGD